MRIAPSGGSVKKIKEVSFLFFIYSVPLASIILIYVITAWLSNEVFDDSVLTCFFCGRKRTLIPPIQCFKDLRLSARPNCRCTQLL